MLEIFDIVPVWLLLALTALCAGFIDAVVGGGGLLTVPALLSTGMPPHMVLGTNKFASTFGTATASYTFYRNKLFSPALWRSCIISTFIGALIGTIAVYLVSGDILEKLLPLLIISTAIYTLFQRPPIHKKIDDNFEPCTVKQAMQGGFLGFYDGFAGPGTGAFWTVSSQILYKVELLVSCGVARSMNFVSNLTALVTFAILGQVDYKTGLLMACCLMTGSLIGAKTAIRFGAKFIRPLFISVVLIISCKLAWGAWF
ncbi:TSUP family transporter [Psychrobium sp. 1_MG-2023]|uniref:sulfite exporter TauE/SafE family protein n=1 Tax=Psychrobium sp. 1_MG-2023 TaxID=3062624 RepID=UPI000C34588D|nr:TSUP family transporter [Psychrobium sp. 1_MG-2023]MDP2559946.1 TSUP family transporter [Psychrobium sp. 1_MG-2023]PKF56386.1 hypothetical protein CW748_10560 [Alteromonadales bacterium alter-6D02]